MNKILIYISGPPCSGKSIVYDAIMNIHPKANYLKGDDFWRKYEGLEFKDRLHSTNTDIKDAVRSIRNDINLVEWVPSNGDFVDELKTICKGSNIDMKQIVIFAPIEILEQRKLKRDGDKNLGPVNIQELRFTKDADVFDSNESPIEEITRQILNHINTWIS